MPLICLPSAVHSELPVHKRIAAGTNLCSFYKHSWLHGKHGGKRQSMQTNFINVSYRIYEYMKILSLEYEAKLLSDSVIAKHDSQ